MHTRKGDTVAVKLAYDIYSLMAVLEGGEYSEIKDMLRSNKSTRSQSGTCNVTINPCESSAEIKELCQNMSAAKADILTLKQKLVAIETTRSSEMQNVKSTVLSLKLDLSSLICLLRRKKLWLILKWPLNVLSRIDHTVL